MNRKALLTCLAILSVASFTVFRASQAVGRPDVTRHAVHFLETAVNVQVEWQSPNPVVLVKISVAGVEKEIKIDAYDNKRNRDGYAGEVNVNLPLDRPVPRQPFTYVIQLEDELRIKSPLVTGRVDVPQLERPGRQVGTIIVILGPLEVAGGGAMWRVENGPWKKSGESVSDLAVGAHTIEFQDIGSWTKPEKKGVKIEDGKTLTINETYKRR